MCTQCSYFLFLLFLLKSWIAQSIEPIIKTVDRGAVGSGCLVLLSECPNPFSVSHKGAEIPPSVKLCLRTSHPYCFSAQDITLQNANLTTRKPENDFQLNTTPTCLVYIHLFSIGVWQFQRGKGSWNYSLTFESGFFETCLLLVHILEDHKTTLVLCQCIFLFLASLRDKLYK